MIKARFAGEVDAWLVRNLPFLQRTPFHPNWLSLAGLAVSLAAAGLFAQGRFRIAALVLALGAFFDLVDGVVARAQGCADDFGAFLDSSIDRVVDMALFFALAMHYAGQGEAGIAWLAGAALLSTVMVSYTKARAEAVLPELRVGLFERAERILVVLAGALLGLMPAALALVTLGSSISIVQRVLHARRGMAALSDNAGVPLRQARGETHHAG